MLRVPFKFFRRTAAQRRFPPGSAFEWILFGQEGEQKAFEEMSQFANEHSLKLAAKNAQN